MDRPVDLSPRQLIERLRRDAAEGAGRFRWRATREFLAEPASFPGAGFDPEDDLEAGITIGLLEVEPRGAGPRWTLRLRIEDEIGSHLPEDGSVPDEPEALDLEAFEAAFLLAGDPDPPAEVALDAESLEARRHFEQAMAPRRRGRDGA